MNRFSRWTVVVAALGIASAAFAQAPAGAPAGTTGVCKDGSYSQSAHKRGACRGHKGVQQWYGDADSGGAAPASGAAPAAAAPAAAPAATAPAAPATASAPAPTSRKSTPFTPPADAAPGGGPGTVWVNTSSNVYHCPGDRWYGKTKQGSYMSEADAKAKGARPDHGRACKS